MNRPFLENELLDLAALQLDENEKKRFSEKLGRVIAYIDQLKKIDAQLLNAENLPPRSSPAHLADLRKDEVVGGLSQEEVLAEAPWTEEGHFLTPPFSRGEDGS